VATNLIYKGFQRTIFFNIKTLVIYNDLIISF